MSPSMSPDSGFLVMWPGGADRHSGIEVTFTRITVRLDQIDEIADAEIARRGGAPARDRFEDGTQKSLTQRYLGRNERAHVPRGV